MGPLDLEMGPLELSGETEPSINELRQQLAEKDKLQGEMKADKDKQLADLRTNSWQVESHRGSMCFICKIQVHTMPVPRVAPGLTKLGDMF